MNVIHIYEIKEDKGIIQGVIIITTASKLTKQTTKKLKINVKI